MEYSKIVIAVQKENMLPLMEIIDFRKNSILLRNLFDQYEVSLPAKKMAEIKMIADVCRFEEWKDHYQGSKLDLEWQLQIFNEGASVKESCGRNAVPKCWILFEELLGYCKLLVSKYAQDYRKNGVFSETYLNVISPAPESIPSLRRMVIFRCRKIMEKTKKKS